ncbi:DNA-binding transcriptional ArsR family regulator [Allocatelliglobosispora scoriae]|uniref:DNA-binding transcriptional ArsR family regulator n=1 Tax=Allocatelliglobosispora scoriae TaxID=643052 RepID=A0A841BME9_9ACTN|nr:winged helix-turn-helix domain-containing protein [Allocatelliglobosispora scoriae]MBB5868031.1 DNA-binding transcriptional ArsR family regulator [Allocatelliglobosispora scoriae]
MLRIHFTGADLAHTRIAVGPDPMWELSLSAHQLRLRGSNPFLDGWKRQVVHRLHPSGPLRARVALTLAVTPPRGYFPDFLTPFESIEGFHAGLEAVLSTPSARLNHELSMLDVGDRSQTPVIDDLRRSQPTAIAALGASMRDYHETAIAPSWDTITAAVEADRSRRVRDLADGGWAKLLNNLHPSASFKGDTLEVGRWGYETDRDLHLAGRGLLIIPSYFKEQRQLMVLADGDLPPVLLYPIDLSARLAVQAGHDSLVALIGRTRADVLEATLLSETTSAIAQRVQISLPAASKHLSVLRSAGLVNSTREQNAVRHSITPLGEKLLAGSD